MMVVISNVHASIMSIASPGPASDANATTLLRSRRHPMNDLGRVFAVLAGRDSKYVIPAMN